MNRNGKPSIIARLFAHWATDADPNEVAEAVDSLMEGEEEPQTDSGENTGAIPAQTRPNQQTPITVTEQDTDVGGNGELVSLLKQLLAKLTNGAADADPELDPLNRLEDALAGKEAGNDPVEQLKDALNSLMPGNNEQTPPPADQEASQTVPAEELNDADPEAEESEEGKPFPSNDSAATLAAIRAMKPYLAKLPASDRRMAADSISRAVRRARGMSGRPAADGYAALLRAQTANARKRAKDSRPQNDTVYGQNCAKRNPHTNTK